MSKAEWYHEIKMACVDSVQSCDPDIPMIVAFNEVNYCFEAERYWGWSSWDRTRYYPYKTLRKRDQRYSCPRIRETPNYKPHVSLFRRTNSGSGWW